MHRLRTLPAPSTVISIVALVLALGGGAYAAGVVPGTSGDAVRVCAKRTTGALRLAKAKCRKGERALSLAQAGVSAQSGAPGVAGPQGAAGATGPQGPAGADGTDATIDGVAAGGDLTGTYPAPKLKNGAVGAAQQAATPSVRLHSTLEVTVANNAYETLTPLSEQGGVGAQGWDVGDMHGGTDAAITIKTAGVYLLTAHLTWDSGSGQREAYLTRSFTGGSELLAGAKETLSSGQFFTQEVSAVVKLDKGDSVYTGGHQVSGGALKIDGGDLSAVWLGP